MPESTTTLLERLDQQHPGLCQYFTVLANYFAGGGEHYKLLLARLSTALEALAPDRLQEACADWERVGILPHVTIENDAQVGAIWTNPMFQTFMETMSFSPPANIDLGQHIPCRVSSMDELVTRRFETYLRLATGTLASGEDIYWQVCLKLQAPELYLEPYLSATPGPKQGCDLACGWGRACLSLPHYEERTVQACDLSPKNLTQLSALVERRGLADKVFPVQADITRLPFEDSSFDFFLAFDIFEHLTNAALDQTLREILRCARPFAVLYTEIPLKAYCPPLTHIQDFTAPELLDRFRSCRAYGRTFRILVYDQRVTDHFAFCVLEDQRFPKWPAAYRDLHGPPRTKPSG